MIIDKQWDWQAVGRGIDAPSQRFNIPFNRDIIRMIEQLILQFNLII